jgi:phospholipid/cholesterol/gamma-HCH transport system substrate-binding protein
VEPKVNYTLVGLFVAVLGAALVAVVLWLSRTDYRGMYDRYYTFMSESVSGLSTDAAVKYRGVDVGRVKEIILAPENSEQVRLTLDIVRGTPIKQDTLAVLETQGLTGIAIVNLTGGSRDSPPLSATPGEQHPIIKSGPSLYFRLDAALSRVLVDESLPALLANLNVLSEEARSAFDAQSRAELKRMLADLASVTQSLAAHRAQLEGAVVSAKEAFGSFAAVGKKLDEQLPNTIEQAQATILAFHAMTQEIGRAGAAIAAALDGNRAGVEQFTGETLAEAGALVSELRQLTADLQRLAQQVERHPNLLVFGRPTPPPGPGE